MKRILFAAVTALGLHGLLFATRFPGLSENPSKRAVPQVLSMRLMGMPHPRNKVVETKPQKKTPPVVARKTLPVKKKKVIPRTSPLPEEQKVLPSPVANQETLAKRAAEEQPSSERSLQSGTVQGTSAAVLQEAMPLYRVNTPPPYPRRAREQGKEGTVLLDVRVDRQGHVQEVRLATSSGSSLLDRTALASVEQWLFEPARKGNEPVEKWVRIPIRFDLQSKRRPQR